MYHYAANNPIRYTDPDGRFDWETNTIQEGDRLWKIADEYNQRNGTDYSYDDVANANGINNPNYIETGQKLDFSNLQSNLKGNFEAASKSVNVYGLNPRIALVVGVGLEGYLVTIDDNAYIVLGIQGGCGFEVGVGTWGADTLKDLIIKTVTPNIRDTIISNALNHNRTSPIPKYTQQVKASVGIGMSYDMNENRINGIEIGNVGGGVYWGARAIWQVK